MADHKKHEMFGLALWIMLMLFLALNYPVTEERTVLAAGVGFCFCFLGSIFPDIDNKGSRMFQHTRLLLGIVSFTAAFVLLSPSIAHESVEGGLMLVGVSGAVTVAVLLMLYALMPPHRGAVHSIRTGALYSAAALLCSFVIISDALLAGVIAVFAFLSFASHLALDR